MDSRLGALPDDIEALKAALIAERSERIAEAARAAYAEAELAVARAKASDDQALIAQQQLRIEKLTRQLFGPRSERTSRILDQIELHFEETGEFGRMRSPPRWPWPRPRRWLPSPASGPHASPSPEHLPRERGDSTGSEPGTQFGTRPARIPG
jgi:transposase